MKTRPLAVVNGPPRLGAPQLAGAWSPMHRSKQLKLFDHFVGAGRQKMRDCDLAELTA
jgi:hypothetical protein